MKLIDLSAARPHVTAPCVCAHCRHRWVAVAPAGKNGEGPEELECPACHQTSNAARFAEVSNMVEVIDQLRQDIIDGKVIAFGAVGIEPDDCTRMWSSSVGGVSRLRMIGAIANMLHHYTHGDL